MKKKKKEYWSQLPFPSPGDLPHPRIEPRSPTLQVDALPSEPPGKTLKKRGDSFNNNNITKISSPHWCPIIWHSFRAFPVYLKKQFFFYAFNWRTIALQCRFWCTTGIRSLYALSPPSWAFLPAHPSRPRLSTKPASLCYPQQPPASQLVYTWQCEHVNAGFVPAAPLHLCPRDCSLPLHLYFCPANRFITTIFLDSIYMH